MTGGRTQGETMGEEQEPTHAGDQDPAKRAPQPDGPMVQPIEPPDTGHEMGDSEHGQHDAQVRQTLE